MKFFVCLDEVYQLANYDEFFISYIKNNVCCGSRVKYSIKMLPVFPPPPSSVFWPAPHITSPRLNFFSSARIIFLLVKIVLPGRRNVDKIFLYEVFAFSSNGVHKEDRRMKNYLCGSEIRECCCAFRKLFSFFVVLNSVCGVVFLYVCMQQKLCSSLVPVKREMLLTR